MPENYSLSNAEHEIMEVLWEAREPYVSRDLLNLFNEQGKNWKRQTLNTLLARLEAKGLIKRESRKIRTRYTKTEYKQLQSMELLNEMYDGSISNFISALTGREQITAEDEQELNKLIEHLK